MLHENAFKKIKICHSLRRHKRWFDSNTVGTNVVLCECFLGDGDLFTANLFTYLPPLDTVSVPSMPEVDHDVAELLPE
jgi:hypothetical protein